ncbi:MAG: ABC transporter substrate-binding protein [Sporichthyaceae bacterium]
MSSRRSVVTGVVASLCLLLGGCGSRVDGSEIVAQSGGSTVRLSDESLEALKAATRQAAAGADAPAAARPALPETTADGQTAIAPVATKVGKRSSAAAAPAGGASEQAAGPAGTAATAATAAGQCAKQLDTIKIGHVGLFSGVAGPILGSAVPMMAAWAKDVNARGGLACHPVQVFTRDDGGDPSRSAAIVKDLAQREGVVAFVGSLTLAPLGFAKAIDQVEVPAVGGGAGDPRWFASPWFFPDSASRTDQIVGLVKHGVDRGKTKLGVLYCVEAAACTESIKEIRDGAAKKAGATLVYDSPISVTQPDFTAQCLNARDAGVDQLALGMDGAAMGRVARSCQAVGYKPLISTVSGLLSPTQAKDPTLRAFGVVTAAGYAPWTENDQPGLREYHRVMKRWTPNLPADGATVFTFVAAKLFERAIEKVAAKAASGTVTPTLIVEGLGTITKDTLGGLTGPITFTPGQKHAVPNGCVFYQLLDERGWTAPRGSRPVCFPK